MSSSSASAFPPGTRIGRYIVLAPLGAGAMGIVLAAYDPELDRKAALKLLEARSADRPKARMRLRREAQALAKLNHANVLTVYDVGVHEDRVFFAMEFVEGRTLSDWMRPDGGQPRPWREIVEVFVAAGRGLAAVHEAGLVHRDFKPDNVMIGDDGRVRLADFGLARLIENYESDIDLRVDTEQPLQTKITRAGASLGTPAYMAPELLLGSGEATVQSDQYGFCVALFEALYGTLPYPGDTTEALFTAVAHGRINEPKAQASLPAWLVRVVHRGMARDPNSRYPSMADLLVALGGGAIRRRRLGVLAAVTCVAMIAAGGFGAREWQVAKTEAECRARGDSIDEIWNDDTRSALREGLLATGVSYAPTAIDKLMPWLDRQAEVWREHATFACRQVEVEKHWDAATYDKVTWCLDQHKVEFQLLIGELSAAEASVVEAAVTSAASLSLVATCTDERSLATLPEPPAAELRPESASIQRELLRASVLENAGQFPEGLEVARAALARAEALGWDHLTSDARGAVALLLAQTGAYAEAEAVGTAAYMQAALSGNWDVAATAAARLIVSVGVDQQRVVEGKIWAEREAVIALGHDSDPFRLREAMRLSSLALLYWRNGDLEQSRRLQERVLEIHMAVFGPDHPNVAATLVNLGATRRALGDYREAREMYERAIATSENMLGPVHPQLSSCLNNLGYLLTTIDEHEASLPIYERALAIQRQTLGAEHPTYANTLGNLGLGHAELGDVERGEELLRETLVTFERALGPNHPAVASTHMNLAHVLVLAERLDEAEDELALARGSLERSVGPEHSSFADVWMGLGELHAARGELEQAREVLERALRMQENSLDPDHPVIAAVLHELGTVHERLGDLERARELYECALAIRENSDGSASDLAESRAALARVRP